MEITEKWLNILSELYSYVLAHGNKSNGIFRVSCEKGRAETLLSQLCSRGLEGVDLNTYDMNEIACLIKKFFQKTTEPIFLFSNYLDIVRSMTKSEDDKKEGILEILRGLPKLNYLCIKSLMSFSRTFANEYYHYTQMNVENLSIVFTPILLRPKRINMQYSKDLPRLMQFVSTLINDYEVYFCQSEHPDKKSVAKHRRYCRKRRSSSLKRSVISRSIKIDNTIIEKYNVLRKNEGKFSWIASGYEALTSIEYKKEGDSYKSLVNLLAKSKDILYIVISCKALNSVTGCEENISFLVVYLPKSISHRRTTMYYHLRKLCCELGVNQLIYVENDDDIKCFDVALQKKSRNHFCKFGNKQKYQLKNYVIEEYL